MHELEHAAVGKIKLLGWAPRMSESAVPIKAAPLLGEHTLEVVAADLGSAADVDRLVEAGVIS